MITEIYMDDNAMLCLLNYSNKWNYFYLQFENKITLLSNNLSEARLSLYNYNFCYIGPL